MKTQKAKTYLIAGGAGFIGSHLCDKLISLNQKVICVDNFSTGQKTNIAQLTSNLNFQLIKADITSLHDVNNLKNLNFDFLLHLASPAGPNPESPKSYHRLWQETYLANSYGTHLLCQLAVQKKAVFLFASSSEIYGNPLKHPQNENYLGNVNPIGPRSIYDESKRLGEAITANFSRHLKMPSRIVRIFNTYGPRMNIDDGRALSLFIYQALNNQPITVYGDGKQTRSFCYIDDQVEGIIKLLESNKANALPINIGNDQEITIITLLEEIKNLLGNLPKIKFQPLPQDDPEKRKPDISLARNLLKWKPKISLKEGLVKTINYYKSTIS